MPKAPVSRSIMALFFPLMAAMASCAGGTPSGAAAPADSQGPQIAPDSAKQAAVELVFSHALQGQAARVLEDAVASFDRSRPDVTVTVTSDHLTGHEARLENAILSGTGPDVFLSGDVFAANWIERKRLVQPLDRLLAARGIVTSGRWQQKYASRVSAAGSLYAVPLAVMVPLLVADPEQVKGRQDMSASAAANAGRPIAADLSDWLVTAAFVGAFDGRIVDSTGVPAFDSDASARAFDFIVSNLAAGGLRDAENAGAAIDLFNSGAVKAAIVWPEHISGISPAKPWMLMPLPTIEGAGRLTPMWHVDALFISSWSRNLDAAADLVVWLASDTGVDSLAREGFPGLFTTVREMPREYSEGMLSRGIRTQQAASTPSPTLASFQATADIFAAVADALTAAPAQSVDAVMARLGEAADRARAADTKFRRGRSLILR